MHNSASIAHRQITADAASVACQAALACAHAKGLLINVAVTDASGTLMAFLRMPGAPLHSIDIAIDKAYTASSFGFPTSRWSDAVARDELLRIGLNQRPRLVMFGGGMPIVEGGARIGGIGVSGGSAAQDESCAIAGIAALNLT